MSRPATIKIGVGVFAESRLIADSLLCTLQKESDIACSWMNGLATAWMHQPDGLILDWQKAMQPKLSLQLKPNGHYSSSQLYLLEAQSHFHQYDRVELNHTLRKLSVRR